MITGQNGRVIDLSTRMYNVPFELVSPSLPLSACQIKGKKRERERVHSGNVLEQKTNQTCKAIEL